MRTCSGRAQPRLDAEDDALLLRFRRDAPQAADDFGLPIRIVPEIPFFEKREQDDTDVERFGDVDAVTDPLFGTGVGFVRHLVHQVQSHAANPDSRPVRGFTIRALHVGAPKLQVVVHAAHRHLHAVESERPCHGQRSAVRALTQ